MDDQRPVAKARAGYTYLVVDVGILLRSVEGQRNRIARASKSELEIIFLSRSEYNILTVVGTLEREALLDCERWIVAIV